MSGLRPREMYTILKQRFPDNVSTMSTFYNFLSKHKFESLEGRSQMQQMFKELKKHDYVEFHREDPIIGECRDIFFAHPGSIDMAKCFPEVMIMDCTYKTVRQKLPLFEIVGFTSTMKTFAVAFFYLEDEKIDNYRWALQMLHRVLESRASSVTIIMTDCELALVNVIHDVFPDSTHLLCRWHVVRNVEANYKKTFDTKDAWETFIEMFKDMIQSSNVDDYERKLLRLKELYGAHFDLISYIERQWLSRYKEKFVSAWTNSIMHFGTVTTNRAESMHASLKLHLGTSLSNLTQNWSIINNLLEKQLNEIMSSFNRRKNIWGVMYRGKPWMQIRGLISKSAMELLARELRSSRFVGVDQEKCGCAVKTTCGIPCAHELSHIVVSEESNIPLSLIHGRWRKLDNMPLELHRGALDIKPETTSIKKIFDTLSEHQKVMMIKKVQEIAEPETTFLQEPRVKENVRGRPKNSKGNAAKFNSSTKREPSAFELAQTLEEREENKQPKKRVMTKLPCIRSAHKKGKKEVLMDVDYVCRWDDGLSELNPIIRDYIKKWSPVPKDGYCGFHTVAKLLGLQDSDGWKLVMQRLLVELNEHYSHYTDIFGGDMMEYLTNNLLCTSDSTSDLDKWFTFPEMGTLVACAFNCVCAHIQPGLQSQSYFPLRNGPLPELKENLIVSMAHIDMKTHYVPIELIDDAPLPPLTAHWKAAWPDALPWKAIFQQKLDRWEKVLPRNFSKLVHGDLIETCNFKESLKDA